MLRLPGNGPPITSTCRHQKKYRIGQIPTRWQMRVICVRLIADIGHDRSGQYSSQ